MHKVNWPDWLLNLHLSFREDDEDEDEDKDDENDEGDDDAEDEDEDSEDSDDDDKDKDKDGKSKAKSKKGQPDDDRAELRRALRDERQKRRKAEREARQAKQQQASKDEKKDAEESQEKLRVAEEKTVRLAARLRKRELEAAILTAATQAGFIDPTDALVDSVMSNIDIDQDDEDPSDIDIDTDSVEDAVKELARKKQHLVGKGTSSVKSGSKQRKKKGDGDKLTQKKLAETYPGLQ